MAAELADEVVKQGIVERISPGHVGRLLAEADLKPHQTQYWLNLPRPSVRGKSPHGQPGIPKRCGARG